MQVVLKREAQKQELEAAVVIHLAWGDQGGSKEGVHHPPPPHPTCSALYFSPHCYLAIPEPGVGRGTGMGVGMVRLGEVLADTPRLQQEQPEDIGKERGRHHHSWQLVELRSHLHHHLKHNINIVSYSKSSQSHSINIALY